MASLYDPHSNVSREIFWINSIRIRYSLEVGDRSMRPRWYGGLDFALSGSPGRGRAGQSARLTSRPHRTFRHPATPTWNCTEYSQFHVPVVTTGRKSAPPT